MVTCSLLDTLPTRHPKSSIAECLAADMFILPGASLVSVEAFNKLGGFDERLSGYEDDDLFLRMFSAGFASCYIKEAVTRWRIYPTSTSYSPRMTASRVVYFRKLAENYPDDPGMTQFWVRDLGAPRFFGQACLEFIKASRSGDKDAALRAWANVVETFSSALTLAGATASVASHVWWRFCVANLLSAWIADCFAQPCARVGTQLSQNAAMAAMWTAAS